MSSILFNAQIDVLYKHHKKCRNDKCEICKTLNELCTKVIKEVAY